MSKWMFGIVGTGIGAMGGAAAVVVLEVGVVAIVGLTLYLAGPQAPVADGAPVQAAAVKKQAPKGAAYGQVHVTTMAAVTMQVDGQYVAFGPAGFLADVEPGQHRLELFDMLGRKKVDEVVTVEKGRRHSFRWRSKAFENMGVHGLIGNDGAEVEPVASTVPVAPVAPVDVVVPTARVKVHDPDLGVDIEMDAGGLQLEVDATTEDRFETVEFGGLEIEVPKLGLHGTSARGMCSPMRAGGC